MRTRMIPRILHQASPETTLPARWRALTQRALALHPDWTYRLWTEKDHRELVEAKRPTLMPLFDALPRPIMRVDVGRMVVLYEYGGVYLDLDYELVRPFDLLRHQVVLPKNRSRKLGDRRDSLGTAILASEPRHPFWEYVFAELIQAGPPSASADPRRVTGGDFLTQIHHQFIKDRGTGLGIATPERPLFHPPTPYGEAEYKTIHEDGVAYGVHHCAGPCSRSRVPVRMRSLLRQWIAV